MQTTRDRSYDEWLTDLRDAARSDDASVDIGDLIETAADDLARYHEAMDSPYELALALVRFEEHYRAAVEEAWHRFSADNDDPLNYVYNVAWSAIYLWYHDRLWCAVYHRVPDDRLANPDELA